jgi:NADH-quinone oxidoreductase subunit B
VPVDVFVAGCPPRPEALIHGVLTLHEKVRGDTFKEYAEKYK